MHLRHLLRLEALDYKDNTPSNTDLQISDHSNFFNKSLLRERILKAVCIIGGKTFYPKEMSVY